MYIENDFMTEGLQNIHFIVLLLEHNLVSPVPELHGTIIAGCVKISLHELISPKIHNKFFKINIENPNSPV